MGNCYIHFFCCCFNNLSSKASEIILISIYSLALALIECCFIIIVWKKISLSSLIILIFILLCNLICLILVIIIRFWRAKDLIKTTYKNAGIIFSTISLILSIICFILCLFEVFIIFIDFSNPKDICEKNYSNCQKNFVTMKENVITIITFIYLFIGLFLGITIWVLLRIKIKNQLDGPIPLILNKYEYGRRITVVPIEQANIRINQYNPGYYFSYGGKDVKDIQNNNPSDDDISDINHECQIPNNIINNSRNIN